MSTAPAAPAAVTVLKDYSVSSHRSKTAVTYCCDSHLPEQLSKDCHKDRMVGTAFVRNSCNI